ncbi:hypothetical protein BKG71_19395 [Mycobacteroides chelonae]|nr:hypothetical protein BKG71_19395 [Mycobacteroides chelonae]
MKGRHRATKSRPRNVILREPPLLHTFVSGWAGPWTFREIHFREQNGRENTYQDEAIGDFNRYRRTMVAAYYEGKLWRFTTDDEGWHHPELVE